ncbi:MAG: glycosyltransferase family 2 protein [Deltaproteobacteria bacterium]|nr:glycosyltransferase family 2 protein [Deltaproteobacteria bacterium]
MEFEIIIPFYNEVGRLEGAVDTFVRELGKSAIGGAGANIRFWWADDGSTDGSHARLESLVSEKFPKALATHRFLRRVENQGKGSILRYAIEQALKEIKPDAIVGFWDADGELDPKSLFEGLSIVSRGEADIVFGTRVFTFEPTLREYPNYLMRSTANRLLTLMSNTLSGLRLADVHCCARMVRADLLARLPLTSDGFDFEAEFAGLVGRVNRRKPLKIREVPIGYLPRTRSEGKKIGASAVLPQVYQAFRCRVAAKVK